MLNIGKIDESTFCALIGDVVGSRALDDRGALQNRLEEALAAVSASLGPETAADLQLTAGDEVQGLLVVPGAAVTAVRELSDRIHPVRMTFGLGCGSLSTGPLPDRREDIQVALLDGPCFHRARRALEDAQRRQVWLGAAGFGRLDLPLGVLAELIGTLRWGWTDKQGQYAAAARRMPQKDVAATFGVSPSVVSESLKAAHFEAVRRGEEGLQALLAWFAENPEWGDDSAEEPKQ